MKQMPNFICLDEDLECNEVQAPIQIHEDNAKNKTNEMLEDSEVLILCKEDLGSTKDTSNLTQPKINEPMSQVLAYSCTIIVILFCHILIDIYNTLNCNQDHFVDFAF